MGEPATLLALKGVSGAALFACGVAGVLLPRCVKESPKLMSAGNLVSAGVLMSSSLVHLLPDAARDMDKAEFIDFPIVYLAAGIGFIFVLAMVCVCVCVCMCVCVPLCVRACACRRHPTFPSIKRYRFRPTQTLHPHIQSPAGGQWRPLELFPNPSLFSFACSLHPLLTHPLLTPSFAPFRSFGGLRLHLAPTSLAQDELASAAITFQSRFRRRAARDNRGDWIPLGGSKGRSSSSNAMVEAGQSDTADGDVNSDKSDVGAAGGGDPGVAKLATGLALLLALGFHAALSGVALGTACDTTTLTSILVPIVAHKSTL